MTVNDKAILPDVEILKDSIRGMKKELHVLHWLLLEQSNLKRSRQPALKTDSYYKRGAMLAKKVLKLKQIITEMNAVVKKAEYEQALKAA